MSTQVGAIVSASCSQCKATEDAEVAAVVGDDIVSVVCKTCGTSQRYRPPVGASIKPRTTARRVVDVGFTSAEPSRSKVRGGRRSEGEDVPLRGVPRAVVPTPTSLEPAQPRVVSTSSSGARNEELFRRWDALTAGLLSRHGRPHRVHETYREGEVILHNVHGMGVVEGVDGDGTLTVLFRRGYQSLASRQTQHTPPSRP